MGTYGNPEDTSPWLTIKKLRIKFNPVVTFGAIIIIWSFIIVCCTVDTIDDFAKAKLWVAETFTWLYIGSQDFWAIFMLVLYFKYGHIKLGKDDEEPEFSDVTWFTMLFACGIGVGLFFFGVSEPISHYTNANRYQADKFMPDNLLAQNAINVTYYHWGVHGWVVYTIVGMLLGIISYREGLPMTMKSCFYPLLGDKVFGWLGDAIDITSIITTLFGVCTSLGLGVIQLNAGLNFLNSDIPVSTLAQVIIIWAITAMATVSTVSGVGMGIRRLSEICFGVGMVLMTLVLMLEDTWYILNLYVQSIGYYIWTIMQLGFHCNAFVMHSPDYGAVDGRARAYTDEGMGSTDGQGVYEWMDWWTIFFWGWWISWSPFVGMFIAKISRGRTIREFINGTMTAPVIYSFFWMTIFGGAGIGSERLAAGQGYCCNPFDATTVEAVTANLDQDLAWNDGDWCGGSCGATEADTCATRTLSKYARMGWTRQMFKDNLLETIDMAGELGDYTVVQNYYGPSADMEDRDVVRLSCFGSLGSELMWFYLVDSYYDVGAFLSVFSIAGIVLYFITSSDSGSLVIDIMSSNGDHDPPIVQRVFWALTEGAAATALLVAGGDEALSALQTVAVICGLPYTFVLCFLCVSIWRLCQVISDEIDPNAPYWRVDYFEFCTTLDWRIILRWFKNILLGPVYASKGAVIVWGQKAWMQWAYVVVMYIFLVLFIAFHVVEIWVSGMWALAWLMYICFCTLLTSMRVSVRANRGYLGNAPEDFFAALFIYPSVCLQIEMEVEEGSLTAPEEELKKE